jgi:hypothetical protein
MQTSMNSEHPGFSFILYKTLPRTKRSPFLFYYFSLIFLFFSLNLVQVWLWISFFFFFFFFSYSLSLNCWVSALVDSTRCMTFKMYWDWNLKCIEIGIAKFSIVNQWSILFISWDEDKFKWSYFLISWVCFSLFEKKKRSNFAINSFKKNYTCWTEHSDQARNWSQVKTPTSISSSLKVSICLSHLPFSSSSISTIWAILLAWATFNSSLCLHDIPTILTI